jgi:predicted RNA-binding Zn ribbon-like protein
MVPEAAISAHDLLGGRLALDFVNTVEPRIGSKQRDFLPNYGALADWSAHAGAISADEAVALRLAASADASRGAAVWRRAIAMREALYRLVLAVAESRRPQPPDLEILTRAFARAQQHAVLAAESGEIRWRWALPTDLERPLWEVARSAVEILTTADADRLRVCRHGTDGCGWVFFDATKNRSRRWCGMADCGTRAKSRRLTDRRRQARSDLEAAAPQDRAERQGPVRASEPVTQSTRRPDSP